MKQLVRRSAAWLLALILVLSAAPFAGAAETPLERTAAYVQRTVSSPAVSSVGGEWAVLGLSQAGLLPAGYGAVYYQNLCDQLEEHAGTLSATKYTEYARVVLALAALGYDPASVNGYDLLAPLADYDKVVRQGINGAVWALIALQSLGDCTAWELEGDVLVSANEKYAGNILESQLPDGGWSLSGKAPADPDVTAMALTALAPRQDASEAVSKGLACLSALQNSDGSFGSPANAESCAQVVLALGALGVSAADSRFIKGGSSPSAALLAFARADGSFSHLYGGEANQMATEQALCALTSLRRQETGESGFFTVTESRAPALRIPAENQAAAAFPDIQGRADQTAVESLARRGVLLGRSDGRFDPGASMTRAEFCAVLVRALGLELPESTGFADVPAWCAGYVAAAYEAGIVKGTSDAAFTPNGTITRQEAAVMAARAAQFAGQSRTIYSQDAQSFVLRAHGTDWAACGGWAGQGLAYCLQNDLLGGMGSGRIRPLEAVTRGEVAQTVYALLERIDAQ